ncbi:MAG: hypothetical protein KJ626_12420 [Verrucomicrobia bacterium]|nr:hypothetical protein [Verrucomicrobiota bacterium]
MDWFERYRPSERTSLHHYHFTQALGLVPMIVVGTFILAEPVAPPPVWWMYLGLGIGLQLLLWGTFALHDNPAVRQRWARWLAAHGDRWFPWFIFLIQNVYMYLAFVILDLAIARLGFGISVGNRLMILSLVTLVPIRRLYNEFEATRRGGGPALIGNFLGMVTTCLVAGFVAHTLTQMTTPGEPTPGKEETPVFLFVWTPAVLVIISSVILFIDRLLHPDRK